MYCDQYQLIMAQFYFRMGMHGKTVLFEHFFRKYPDYGTHKSGYCINAGLEWFIDWMQNSRITDEEIEYLRGHRDQNGSRVFEDDFLAWLKNNENFEGLSISAIPEGRVVHANEPLTWFRVRCFRRR